MAVAAPLLSRSGVCHSAVCCCLRRVSWAAATVVADSSVPPCTTAAAPRSLRNFRNAGTHKPHASSLLRPLLSSLPNNLDRIFQLIFSLYTNLNTTSQRSAFGSHPKSLFFVFLSLSFVFSVPNPQLFVYYLFLSLLVNRSLPYFLRAKTFR